MPRNYLLQKIGPLQNDAAASVLRRRLPEIAQERRFLKHLPQRPLVVNRFLGELNNRARLNIAPGADVMRKAGRRRAQRSSFAVVISIDNDDWLLGPHLDDKPPAFKLLL